MESVLGLMPASERSSSLKRRGPSARSRSITRVHLPGTIWAVARTGHVTPAASGALLDPMIVADVTTRGRDPRAGRDACRWSTRPPAANVGRAVSAVPPSPAPRRGRLRITPRRIAAVLAVWALAVGAALLLADALDSPVGAGGRDEAQAVAPGAVAVPGSAMAGGQGLPPLALVLDRPPPAGIADLPPIRQASRLSELAQRDPDPRRLVELGSVLQLLGAPQDAARAYRAALAKAPGDVAARAGLAMVDGGGGDGLARAAAGLAALAAEHPDDQLVAFNQGWVEIYRRRAGPAERAWRRTVALGEDTRLGHTATALLAELRRGGG